MVSVRSQMSAVVQQVRVEVGQQVSAEDVVVVLDSMKMEIPVIAGKTGVVVAIRVAVGDMVEEDQVVAELE